MTPSPLPSSSARVLLVEDSDIDAELICIHLDRAGVAYQLLRARNKREFENTLAREPVDLILADYSLPDFDGLAALDIAKRHRPDVPVVFVSGVGGEDLATDALRRGATDYVVKRNLGRLPGSLVRALAETRERQQRRRAEADLVKSEANMRLALDAATLGLWQYRSDARLNWDERCEAMLGIAGDGTSTSTSTSTSAGAGMRADAGEGTVAHTGPGADGVAYADFLALAHHDDREALDRAVRAALVDDGQASLAFECRFVAGAGALRWIAIHGRCLSGVGTGEGRELRMTGVMRDVTATRRLESNQRHAELLFKLAAQATGMGIWEIGPGRDDVWVDEGYRRIAGLAADAAGDLGALIGDGAGDGSGGGHASVFGALDAVSRRRSASDGAAVRPAEVGAADAARPPRDEIDFEHRIVRANDGQARWVAVKGRRIVGIDGLDRLVGTVRDVTEQRRLQEVLVESNEELERRVAARTRELTWEIAERGRVENTLRQMQRLEAVGQLTSGVAHDFNNLLTVVLSNISLIQKLLRQQPAADERVAKRLESMRDAANRGATLTRQLLAFSRRQRLEPQSVDFNEIVLGMRDLLQTTLGGSVHLQTELAPDAWPALVDPTQMELIILNLAINARDAMEVGGSLVMRTCNAVLKSPPVRPEEPEPGEYVVLSVSDTGSGMSPEVLAKAFEPFFTTKEVGKGSGLGLAQVFGVAKQSGGGVRIETEWGRGTTVRVFMPRSPDTATAAAEAARRAAGPTAASPAAAAAAPHHRTVLLVDDDHAVREATASLLESHGYRVEASSNAADALQRLQHTRAHGIDIVLADFAMPRMNGADMAAAIREHHPRLPIVFLTGYADTSALAKVRDSYLLQKPVAENELVERLNEALKL